MRMENGLIPNEIVYAGISRIVHRNFSGGEHYIIYYRNDAGAYLYPFFSLLGSLFLLVFCSLF